MSPFSLADVGLSSSTGIELPTRQRKFSNAAIGVYNYYQGFNSMVDPRMLRHVVNYTSFMEYNPVSALYAAINQYFALLRIILFIIV